MELEKQIKLVPEKSANLRLEQLLGEQEQLEGRLLEELEMENLLGHRNLRILDLRDPYSKRQSSKGRSMNKCILNKLSNRLVIISYQFNEIRMTEREIKGFKIAHVLVEIEFLRFCLMLFEIVVS